MEPAAEMLRFSFGLQAEPTSCPYRGVRRRRSLFTRPCVFSFRCSKQEYATRTASALSAEGHQHRRCVGVRNPHGHGVAAAGVGHGHQEETAVVSGS